MEDGEGHFVLTVTYSCVRLDPLEDCRLGRASGLSYRQILRISWNPRVRYGFLAPPLLPLQMQINSLTTIPSCLISSRLHICFRSAVF
jgi:hypothetical protein